MNSNIINDILGIEKKPDIIKVAGVGGAGCGIVEHIYKMNIPAIECLLMNTDAAALDRANCPNKLLLGKKLVKGLGCERRIELGRQCAEESRQNIAAAFQNTDMVIIIAGMGGGTGTGASPVVAQIAKEMGIITAGLVTTPFDFEGEASASNTEQGLSELMSKAGTLMIFSNREIVSGKKTMAEALMQANDALGQAVHNLVRSVLSQEPG